MKLTKNSTYDIYDIGQAICLGAIVAVVSAYFIWGTTTESNMITLDGEDRTHTILAGEGEVINNTCLDNRFTHYKTSIEYHWNENKYDPPLTKEERAEVNKQVTLELPEDLGQGVTTYTFHQDNLTGCIAPSPY